jgi:hypothetical protein
LAALPPRPEAPSALILPLSTGTKSAGRASAKPLALFFVWLARSTRNLSMELITKAQIEQLLANGRAQREVIDQEQGALDFKAVVKLFTPDGSATLLLTELDPDGGLAFGLCDLGVGEPELGYVSLAELRSVRGRLGLPIERDLHFQADETISVYAIEARERGHIVT